MKKTWCRLWPGVFAAALAMKYPNADRAWAWQWVFPSPVRVIDPRSDAGTIMIYTHVMNKGGRGILCPLDAL